MIHDPRPEARGHLFGVAYRMLGSAHDAEDAVQEAFVRWERLGAEERAEVREPVAWLTRVVSRICLDQLGSARARREEYTGIWLPEPVPGSVGPAVAGPPAPDPADVVTLDESVSLALLKVLEQLTPPERVALVLHDVFGLSFAEVGTVVGRSEAASRQLASTARRHVRGQRRFAPDGAERDATVRAFARACTEGDLLALTRVLDPDAVLMSDGGGIVSAARNPVSGADHVARFLLGLVTKAGREGISFSFDETVLNGRRGFAVHVDGALTALVDLAVAGGAVHEILVVLNPEKLGRFS